MNTHRDKWSTKFISKKDEFYSLITEWDELLEDSARNNPFLSFQWMKTWWEVYGNGKLQILTVRASDNRLHGIFPLFRPDKPKVLGTRMLSLMGSTNVSSDFMNCIARKGHETAVYSECISTLMQKRSEWDVLLLQDLEQDSSFYEYLKVASIRNMEVSHNPQKTCPSLPLPPSWSELLGCLSKKKRQNIGYYRRALERLGHVELEGIHDPAETHQAFADMIRLRRDRMEQKGFGSSKVNKLYIQFNSRIFQRFISCNRLRLYFLKFNNQRIAYLYLYHGGDTLYFYQTGFDRAWERNSVGTVLLGMVIEKAIDEGYKNFEFLRGNESYKYEWGKIQQNNLVDVTVYSGKTKANIYRCCKRCVSVTRKILDWLRRKEPCCAKL